MPYGQVPKVTPISIKIRKIALCIKPQGQTKVSLIFKYLCALVSAEGTALFENEGKPYFVLWLEAQSYFSPFHKNRGRLQTGKRVIARKAKEQRRCPRPRRSLLDIVLSN